MLFDEFLRLLHTHFAVMQQSPLAVAAVEKEHIWGLYLDGLAPEDRQEHTCNACRHFLQRYGGIVAITETLQRISLWDCALDRPRYAASVQALASYVASLPLTDILAVEAAQCGVPRHRDPKRDVVWHHVSVTVPTRYVTRNVGDTQATYRGHVQVLQRALDELTVDASTTVLDLIEQHSLYRGKQFEESITAFWQLQRQYAQIDVDHRQAFVWRHADNPVAHIRTTAIGTLLTDLSDGMALEAAVARYEHVVAPSNYQRPSTLITSRMITDAQRTITDLGLSDALQRRYARVTDLPIEDILFKYTPQVTQNIFAALHKEVTVDPQSVKDVPEIAIEHFLAEMLPQATKIEILLENRHRPHLVTLLTAEDDQAPRLFAWENPFSWSYTGQVADSIKERVKQAGGNVTGVLRISLAWHNHDDLDLHVIEPSGHHIFFGDQWHRETTGQLDVDMNASTVVDNPVENIVWTDRRRMQANAYRVYVNNYRKRETTRQGFTVEVEYDGTLWTFEQQQNTRTEVTTLTLTEDSLVVSGQARTGVDSTTMWGLTTNRFQTVTHVLLSPNHWGGKRRGNKHYFFTLDGCGCDEAPRPFYNEFLSPELHKHRQVFEVLGGKLVIAPSSIQLSGLGFSETQPERIAVRLHDGRAQRIVTLVF